MARGIPEMLKRSELQALIDTILQDGNEVTPAKYRLLLNALLDREGQPNGYAALNGEGRVGSPGPHVTTERYGDLNEAVEAAHAGSGTLILMPGTHEVSEEVVIPTRMSVIGPGPSLAEIVPREGFRGRLVRWSSDPSPNQGAGRLQGFTINGRRVAAEGLLTGVCNNALMSQVNIEDVAGRGLVLHRTQNMTQIAVQVQRCDVNFMYANGAWNNEHFRCEGNQPNDGGYNLLSRKDPGYSDLFQEKEEAKDNRHNKWFGGILERGAPANVIRLEDDSGKNVLAGTEITGGSEGSSQVYVGPKSGGNLFSERATIHRGATLASFALENHGFGTIFDTVVGVSWSDPDYWAMTDDLFINLNPGGSFADDRILSTAAGGAIRHISSYHQFYNGALYAVINEILKVTQKRESGDPYVLAEAVIEAAGLVIPNPETSDPREPGKLWVDENNFVRWSPGRS